MTGPAAAAEQLGLYMLFLLTRSASSLLKALRTPLLLLLLPFRDPRSRAAAAMQPLKIPLIVLRLVQVLPAAYTLFALFALLVETIARSIVLDAGLLGRLVLAGLGAVWTAVMFCGSTCCNGARVLALPGTIGDVVAMLAYLVVAVLSRGQAGTNCFALGDKLMIYSDGLDRFVEPEGNAMGGTTVAGLIPADIVQRLCRYGQSAFAGAVANW